MYEQKQSPFWWTRNPATIIYFLRELTGLFLSGALIYFIVRACLNQNLWFLHSTSSRVVSMVGLIAALIHTITWLWVTVQVTPFDLKKSVQVGGFIVLMTIWLGISYFIFKFLYLSQSLI